jgi:hypothetical protein
MSEIKREITMKTERTLTETDDLQGLFETAGRRPEVPTADLAAIKAAARLEWQRLVNSRQRRWQGFRSLTPAALAAGLALVLVIGWWWMSRGFQPAAEMLATIDLLAGEIRVEAAPERPGDQVRAPFIGDALRVGDRLVTAERREESRSWASLRWASGHSVRLDSGTEVLLASKGRLELQKGAVYLDSANASDSTASLEVMTPFGSVREIGTQFEVRLEEGESAALRVRVREGEVALVRDDHSHSVAVGQELTLTRDGSLSRSEVARYGSEWEWVLAAAPGFDIEGATLAAFLDWVSRESGWSVKYADEAPVDSLGVVLPATGLGYRLESGGTLLVTRTSG